MVLSHTLVTWEADSRRILSSIFLFTRRKLSAADLSLIEVFSTHLVSCDPLVLVSSVKPVQSQSEEQLMGPVLPLEVIGLSNSSGQSASFPRRVLAVSHLHVSPSAPKIRELRPQSHGVRMFKVPVYI